MVVVMVVAMVVVIMGVVMFPIIMVVVIVMLPLAMLNPESFPWFKGLPILTDSVGNLVHTSQSNQSPEILKFTAS